MTPPSNSHPNLCVENMDKRKPVARTVDELEAVFGELPDAGFCLDLGHARPAAESVAQAIAVRRL